ncbi:MAG: lipid-A-disaccharide synthase [Proteobacteria bacterium]|nr:lipid-A-disaccharide synthase [Pseudomonadota bacterium]
MTDAPPDNKLDEAGPLVFLIAGEASGDDLGARLMAALKRRTANRVRFAGVGGAAMAREGLDSLFPIGELSLMGLAEILPHLPRLLRRLGETAAEVARLRPRAVVTIDSPEFSFRVARRIAHLGIPRVHYVAPQVWAWRKGRARKLSGTVDRLMALLPFEPPYFEDAGLPCDFVGHPVIESGADRGDGAAFRTRHGIAPEATVVSVLPGSRHNEVRCLLPVFEGAVELLARQRPELVVAVATVEAVRDEVTAAVRTWSRPGIVVTGRAEKFDAFAASRAAIAKSGTVTLELALAGVPMVVCYKVSAITAFLARRLLKVDHVGLVNLLTDRVVAPELLQDACTPAGIAEQVAPLLERGAPRAAQLAGFEEVVGRLGGKSPAPSERAAEVVLGIVEGKTG